VYNMMYNMVGGICRIQTVTPLVADRRN